MGKNKEKDNKTKQELIEDPKALEHVTKLAWHYYRLIRAERRGMITIEDLISAGYEGLVVAADRYKSGSGAKFTTYSTWWIKGEMLREMIFYIGEDALLMEDAEKIMASKARSGEGVPDEGFDIGDIPLDEQLRIITSKLAEFNLTKEEITVYLALNGIGRDKVTNLKILCRELNIREMEIRRLKQSAEDKVKSALKNKKVLSYE